MPMNANIHSLNRRSLIVGAGAASLVTQAAAAQSATPSTSPEASPVATPIANTDTLMLPCGPVYGIAGDRVDRYVGIPYGESTAGEGRWAAPKAKAVWTEPLAAVKPGPMAPQTSQSFADISSEDEDCLYINVTVPRGTMADAALPVMVWFHGGGGTNGSGDIFDPERLVADENVIVVTFNWRLGVFGAFGLKGLEDSGTFGLLDCQLALLWVQTNIAGFGGDPANVTIFGESYGALTISGLLVSPLFEGLFHKAIVQSSLALIDYPAETLMPGSPALPSMWLTARELEETTNAMLGEIGIDPASENLIETLRSVPVKDILPLSGVYTRYAWGNRVLPEDPVARIKAGQVANVPIISGGCRDEARLFVGTFYDLTGNPVTEESYPELVAAAFGEKADAVTAEYPLSDYESPGVAWATVVTDSVWATATMAQNKGVQQGAPTWCYQFADRTAPPIIDMGPDMPAGAHHSAEVQYQFDMEGQPAPLNDDQWALASAINAYWAGLARTGDPNGNGLPMWDPYDGGDMLLSLDVPEAGIAPVDYAADHHLAFWADVRG